MAIAEVEAKAVLPRASVHEDEIPVYPAPYDDLYERLSRIAEESPTAAIIEAWIEVETALNEALVRYNIPRSVRTLARNSLIELVNTGQYAKTIISFYEDLRDLRNQAAHGIDFAPPNDVTRRYLQLAIELALTFRNPLYED